MTSDPKPRQVGDLMNPNVVCVRPEASVREVETLFRDRGITGAPVVDEAGQPLGVVSQHDLISHQADRSTAGSSGRFYSDVDDYRDIASVPVDRSNTPVSELMSTDLLTVDREASAYEAASLMRNRRVHRLLVLRQGVLVGIVSSLDLLGAIDADG